MSLRQTITFAVIVSAVILLIGYDLYVVCFWGQSAATESNVMLMLAHRYPVIPFALGLVMGHFFWSQGLEASYDKLKTLLRKNSSEKNSLCRRGLLPGDRVWHVHA